MILRSCILDIFFMFLVVLAHLLAPGPLGLLGDEVGFGNPGVLGLYPDNLGFPVDGLDGEAPGFLVGDLFGDLPFLLVGLWA